MSDKTQTEKYNKKHRPVAVGVQGLADVFILMRYPFESPEAHELNKKIFETIYFAALTASCELAKTNGSYDSYHGSPASKGVRKYLRDMAKRHVLIKVPEGP